MPFDGFDPGIENPVRVLELIEERLQSGRMWARGCTFAADGRVCLLGAHYSVTRGFDDNGLAGRSMMTAVAAPTAGENRRKVDE